MIACKDCFYVFEVIDNDGTFRYARCLHAKAFKELPNYYEGKPRAVAVSVETMRSLGECGHEATLFRNKKVPIGGSHETVPGL